MSAPTGVRTAPTRIAPTRIELWRDAAAVRDRWLEIARLTEPADRITTEATIAAIYQRLRRPVPEFLWVDSPRAAGPYLGGLPTHDDLYAEMLAVRRDHTVASDLAADLAGLRHRLHQAVDTTPVEPPLRKPPKKPKGAKPDPPLPPLPPEAALARGDRLRAVVADGVRGSLETSLLRGVCDPVRAAAGITAVGWYGQQDVHWLAEYDAWRRIGLADYPSADAARLAEWAALARSTGWWWPGERRCVLAERPVELDLAPIRNAWYGEVRLVRAVYRDGFTVDRTAGSENPLTPTRRISEDKHLYGERWSGGEEP